MTVSYTKLVDVVTEVVDSATPTGRVLQPRKLTHSGEEVAGAIARVAPANTTSAALGKDTFHSEIEITIANAGTDITFPAPFAGKIVGGYAVKSGTSADAGDKVEVSLAGTVYAAALLNVADKVQTPLTIDLVAGNAFAEGATITVNPTKSTDCACTVFLKLKRTA
ncbi:hypothetical protein UFOVP777_6 [uncultured Caudovirales phage]|uniref:Uncharacterized protein n=1 Tax=uncultured Caudovirales phage TaxID=2100421 RepID=A0A6J5P2X6_9CAUD|nr:hypothetical protein UFOVP777_6 [uncultured Caudovirales phage]